MGGVRVVTDSCSGLSPEAAGALGVEVVPLIVSFGDESFLDGVEISTAEFYARMRKGGVLPRTSQPSPGQFLAAFSRLAGEGAEGIVVITVAARLTGTFQSALQAAESLWAEARGGRVRRPRPAAARAVRVSQAASGSFARDTRGLRGGLARDHLPCVGTGPIALQVRGPNSGAADSTAGAAVSFRGDAGDVLSLSNAIGGSGRGGRPARKSALGVLGFVPVVLAGSKGRGGAPKGRSPDRH